MMSLTKEGILACFIVGLTCGLRGQRFVVDRHVAHLLFSKSTSDRTHEPAVRGSAPMTIFEKFELEHKVLGMLTGVQRIGGVLASRLRSMAIDARRDTLTGDPVLCDDFSPSDGGGVRNG